VRFRIVLEAAFPTADPFDPRGYQPLLARWRDSVERNADVPCKDLTICESLTIGDRDDYDDWRRQRGQYDPSTWPDESTGKLYGREKADQGGERR